MVEKAGTRAVCGHCQLQEASTSCPSCQLIVCDDCAATWDSCGLPRPLVVDLGIGPILDVDPEGLVGVGGDHGPLQLIELRTCRQLKCRIDSDLACLAAGPSLVTPVKKRRGQWCGLRVRELRRGGRVVTIPTEAAHDKPLGLVGCAEGRLVLLHNGNQELELIDPLRGEYIGRLGLPRSEMPACVAASCVADLLVVGQGGVVFVLRCDGKVVQEELMRRRRRVAWVGLIRRELVYVDDAGTVVVSELNERDGATFVGQQSPVWPSRVNAGGMIAASLAPDGEYFAVGRPALLTLYESGSTHAKLLQGHGARVTLLRFVKKGKVLLSADQTGKIIFRPLRQLGIREAITLQPGSRASLPALARRPRTRPCMARSIVALLDEETPLDLDDRELCSDGFCIGVVGPGGRCKVCGKLRE